MFSEAQRQIDENYFFLALYDQTGDKLAKPPFFVAYSQLCRPFRNLAEGGCLLLQFHFTLISPLFGSRCLF